MVTAVGKQEEGKGSAFFSDLTHDTSERSLLQD
jgi:hypothetical protein